MLKYKIPKPKKSKEGEPQGCGCGLSMSRPSAYFPVSKEMLKEGSVGDEVCFVLYGNLKSLESRQYEGEPAVNEIRMEITEIQMMEEKDEPYEPELVDA